jgi:hypothetical protein
LRKIVVETLEEDYKSHDINITVSVTKLTIDKIQKKESDVFISYLTQGRVSYKIQGKYYDECEYSFFHPH